MSLLNSGAVRPIPVNFSSPPPEVSKIGCGSCAEELFVMTVHLILTLSENPRTAMLIFYRS
jgi:hypothetical protein